MVISSSNTFVFGGWDLSVAFQMERRRSGLTHLFATRPAQTSGAIAGNWTPVSHVTGAYTHHYTTTARSSRFQSPGGSARALRISPAERPCLASPFLQIQVFPIKVRVGHVPQGRPVVLTDVVHYTLVPLTSKFFQHTCTQEEGRRDRIRAHHLSFDDLRGKLLHLAGHPRH